MTERGRRFDLLRSGAAVTLFALAGCASTVDPGRATDDLDEGIASYEECELRAIGPSLTLTGTLAPKAAAEVSAVELAVGATPIDPPKAESFERWEVLNPVIRAQSSVDTSLEELDERDGMYIYQRNGLGVGLALEPVLGGPVVVYGLPLRLDGEPAFRVEAVLRADGDSPEFLWPCPDVLQADFEYATSALRIAPTIETLDELWLGDGDVPDLLNRVEEVLAERADGSSFSSGAEDWHNTAPAEREFVLGASIPSTERPQFIPTFLFLEPDGEVQGLVEVRSPQGVVYRGAGSISGPVFAVVPKASEITARIVLDGKVVSESDPLDTGLLRSQTIIVEASSSSTKIASADDDKDVLNALLIDETELATLLDSRFDGHFVDAPLDP